MIKIFNPNDTDFTSAGNICINPLKCIETKSKSLNGWSLSIEVDINYQKYIKKDYLVVCKTKSLLNPQAFRIDSNIEYTSNKISFIANHVYYDSENYFLLDVRPTKLNAISALEYINERTDKESPFSVYSDIDSVSTSYFIRKNLLEAWQIFEERYSGYFQFDNWNASMKQNISRDTGIIISYSQYLESLNIIEDWSNVVTRLYPTGPNGIMLDEKYLDADIQYDIPYTKTIQFDSDIEFELQTDENLKQELKEKAIKYINENKYPKISYEVQSNVNQELDIGYMVQIKHPLVDISVEVIEYQYDLNLEKTISLVFGNFTRDVKKKFDSIKQEINSQAEKISSQGKLIQEQTNLINSLNKNGYVYISDNEVLILDKLPKEKAKNVWRWGLGGLGFSSKGYEGPFSTAITQDGKINADFILAGKINTNLIEGYEQLITKVSKTEETIEDITTTTQTSTGGNSLYLKEALESNALEYSIDGKCEQETSEGKNLLNLIPSQNNLNGLTVVSDTKSSLKISGTATGTFSLIGGMVNDDTFAPAGTYTLSAIKTGEYNVVFEIYDEDDNAIQGQILSDENSYTFTSESGLVSITIFISGLSENTEYNDIVYLQLENGSNATDWQQYGVHPSPDNPSEIKTIKGDENGKLKVRVIGKNLANIDEFQVSGGGVSNPYNQEITNLKDNTPYILSFTKSRINGVTISNNALFTYHSISYYNETTLISSEQNTKAITLSDGSIDVNIPIITPAGCNKIAISFANWNGDTNINTLVSNVQFEQGTGITDYEQYKEKEILIDLAKNNLFNSSLFEEFDTNLKFINLQLEPNTSYTMSSNYLKNKAGTYGNLFFYNTKGSAATGTSDVSLGISRTIITSNDGIGRIAYRDVDNEYSNEITDYWYKVYKGTNADDSYELNSINDIKDKFEILNGVVDIQKKIGKIVLSDSEEVIVYATASSGNGFYIKIPNIFYGSTSSEKRGTLLSDKFLEKTRNELYLGNNGIAYNVNSPYLILYYDYCKSMTIAEFKSWLQSNPVTVYYELADPETIALPNINIPLYEGVNHVTLVEDLETTTSIKYLRKTPISGEYALNQDLNETNSNLADTNNQLNQAQNDINSTNTNLNNNYYNKEQVDSINSTTTKNITQIRNTMEQNITSANASISKIQEEITNGISKVTTTTGTFDENGLNISKSGQQMSSTLDWDGFEVIRDKGKSTEAEVLTVRPDKVASENMEVRTYFTQKPIRNEQCVSITDSESVGYGTYWIGEE